MIRPQSFQTRLFVTLLLLSIVPAAAAVGAGVWALDQLGATVGTLGPWEAVAESGRALIDEALTTAPLDEQLAAAAERHGDALSESLRRSSVWTLVSQRARALLPTLALAFATILTGLALVFARWMSSSIARPIHELVGWTDRIAREEPLPEPVGGAAGPAEFAVLRSSLRSMAARLEEARRSEVESARLRAWTDMARRVAHELKNPLTPMRMAATTLARRDDPTTRETADVLLDEIGRLEEMARTFSQFGRMPEGPTSEVDLEELSHSLAERHGTPVQVTVHGEVRRIQGHYEVLSRAIRNLLANARDAMTEAGADPERQPVEIVLEPVDGGVRIAVRDRGVGIPGEILEDLWMPDVTTKLKGTGLGLAVVRQAAESHGGIVAARNRNGGGAEVSMTLPAAPSARSGEHPADEDGSVS